MSKVVESVFKSYNMEVSILLGRIVVTGILHPCTLAIIRGRLFSFVKSSHIRPSLLVNHVVKHEVTTQCKQTEGMQGVTCSTQI